ncbi:hypothetical protein ACFXPS_35265 [Nocardia sp. NPDC059091]|uniref:hypothetical protein n=1 Tax=unclassified Nocardia TaxID=2637762 RepID=UPI0036BD3ACF
MSEKTGATLAAIVRIAVAATQFDWTWTIADAERFAEHLGWGAASVQYGDRLEERRQRGRVPRHVELFAQLNPQWRTLSHGDAPDVRLMALLGKSNGVAVDIPTPISDNDLNVLDLMFEELGARFRALWGEPTGVSPGTPQVWVHQRIVVDLATNGSKTFLRLQNPAIYQRTMKSLIDSATKAERLTDWSAFLSAIPLVTQSDLGTWSRADITRIAETTGWQTRELEGLLRNHLRVALESDREWIFLDASDTSDDPDLARSGFGEFSGLLLMQRLSTEVGDAAYRAALAECVRLLGVPARVGGPSARAVWRRPDVTITLFRHIGNLTSLYLQLEPTAAVEDYRRRVLDSDDERKPHGSWLATPDDALGHRWGNGRPDVEREATTWAVFKACLQPVFESLAADIPVLHPYAGRVQWTVGRRGEPDGWLVRGWFGNSGSRLELPEVEGRTRMIDYLPGRQSGRDIAMAVLTTLRDEGLGSPTQLWCNASMPERPPQLSSLQLGLNHQQ